MMADIVVIVLYAFHNIGMTVSYIIGIQDPFRCDGGRFSFFPIFVIMYTFIMLSVEKFIGIKYALRHKAIVIHRRAYQAIAAGWITALLHKFTGLIYDLTAGTEYDKLSQFDLCLHKQPSFLNILFTPTVPIFLAFFITITLEPTYPLKHIKCIREFKRKMERKSKYLRTSSKKLFSSSSQ